MRFGPREIMPNFDRVVQRRFFHVLPEELEFVRSITGNQRIRFSAVESGHVGLVRFYDLPLPENLKHLDRFKFLSEVNLLGLSRKREITPLLAERSFFSSNNNGDFKILSCVNRTVTRIASKSTAGNAIGISYL